MDQRVKVADAKDVPVGGCLPVEVAGRKLALFNVDGDYYAIDDTCPHEGGPLSAGDLDSDVATCPWHGAEFDVTTGEALSPPAPSGVTRYKVRVEGGEIAIDLT
ncbi:MAG: Rieske (2Fe-2S) protein [Planctomycetota bacterium]|jgi:nitrite reductase/ring-hydroxylating ferredoxin subunit